jgi:Fe-S-cluster containining protein
MSVYLNPDLCAACGGSCCKQMPGSVHPADVTRDQVRAMLASGRYAVDWWDGDPRSSADIPDGQELAQAYFLRPATQGQEGCKYDPSWGGPCTFLAEDGCTLVPSARPYQCRLLEPRPKRKCIEHSAGKSGIAVAWIPYQDWLTEPEEDTP